MDFFKFGITFISIIQVVHSTIMDLKIMFSYTWFKNKYSLYVN